ncbi:MAG: DUF2238 domain-containing protein [Verrucomicrobiae bacterium]|nr:DUF2238 domain-containing protein [Verrucomicrobiae bacterium]
MPILPPSHRRFLVVLCGLYALWWLGCVISPRYPKDWWLENILIFFTLGFLLVTARWFVFSRTSYLLTVVFTAFHTFGAHYTYAEVPVEAWCQTLAGGSMEEVLGWERNHFDRIVHFFYGFLITWPYREVIYYAAAPRRDFWSYLLPVSFVIATSALYELLEWLAAVVLGGDLGMAFLGTQGDIWDAHWDMLMATIGSLLCALIMLGIQLITKRDFAKEWGMRYANGR